MYLNDKILFKIGRTWNSNPIQQGNIDILILFKNQVYCMFSERLDFLDIYKNMLNKQLKSKDWALFTQHLKTLASTENDLTKKYDGSNV